MTPQKIQISTFCLTACIPKKPSDLLATQKPPLWSGHVGNFTRTIDKLYARFIMVCNNLETPRGSANICRAEPNLNILKEYLRRIAFLDIALLLDLNLVEGPSTS